MNRTSILASMAVASLALMGERPRPPREPKPQKPAKPSSNRKALLLEKAQRRQARGS